MDQKGNTPLAYLSKAGVRKDVAPGPPVRGGTGTGRDPGRGLQYAQLAKGAHCQWLLTLLI